MSTKLAALRADRGKLSDRLIEFCESDDFSEAKHAELLGELHNLDVRIKAAEDARRIAAASATIAREDVSLAGGLKGADILSGRFRGASLRAFTARNFNGDQAAANEAGYASGMWIASELFGLESAKEWCRQRGIGAVTRAQGEGINSAGGILVPPQMETGIIVLREMYGVFRRECQVLPMSRDTLNWPRRTSGLTAYFVGENQTYTESQAGWDNVSLTAKKLAAQVRLSTELSEDAVINVADYLVNEIAYAFAVKEDDCGFNGDGTSSYGGIRGTTVIAVDSSHTAGRITAAAGHNKFSLLDATDVTTLIGTLPAYATPTAKFYCSQFAFATVFQRLVASAGGNSIRTLNGEVEYSYLGFPIVICQKMPLTSGTFSTGAVMMHFGDLRLASAMGERRGITIKTSDQRYIDSDQVAIFGNERFDINNHDLGDNSNAGPLVTLVSP